MKAILDRFEILKAIGIIGLGCILIFGGWMIGAVVADKTTPDTEVSRAWGYERATTKPAEVRAKDPKPPGLPHGFERRMIDGHLYYYLRQETANTWATQASLIHAAGCTNHTPCPLSVQAEAPFGK